MQELCGSGTDDGGNGRCEAGRDDQADFGEDFGTQGGEWEREYVFSQAGDVAGLVGYCKVTVAKARCYVNVQGKGQEGMQWADALDKALMLRGERTEDVEAPGPVFKELKHALRQMRVPP